MTTIAYKDGVMAADTRAYAGFNTSIGEKRKVRRLADGTLVGCSTNRVGFGEAIIDWYSRGVDPDKHPTAGETKFALLAVKPNGDGFYAYDDFLLSGPLRAPCFAIGSGEGAALGAMYAGATAERAVEIACDIDIWSGRPITVLRHEADG